MNKDTERLYTVAEVAARLNITHIHACDLIRRGLIKGTKRACENGNKKLGRWVVSESDLQQYLKTDLKLYVKEKLKVLKQLRIKLTPWQLDHLYDCKTEFDVDAFYHDILTGKARTE